MVTGGHEDDLIGKIVLVCGVAQVISEMHMAPPVLPSLLIIQYIDESASGPQALQDLRHYVGPGHLL